jgi:hypothetical protein
MYIDLFIVVIFPVFIRTNEVSYSCRYVYIKSVDIDIELNIKKINIDFLSFSTK